MAAGDQAGDHEVRAGGEPSGEEVDRLMMDAIFSLDRSPLYKTFEQLARLQQKRTSRAPIVAFPFHYQWMRVNCGEYGNDEIDASWLGLSTHASHADAASGSNALTELVLSRDRAFSAFGDLDGDYGRASYRDEEGAHEGREAYEKARRFIRAMAS